MLWDDEFLYVAFAADIYGKGVRAKDFAEADRIRKELDGLGVLLEDSKAGTTWKYKG